MVEATIQLLILSIAQIAARGTHRHRVVKRPSEIISPHSKQFTPDNANSHMKVTSMTLRFPSSTWLTIALPWFFQMGAFCEVEDSLDSGSDSATQIFRMGDECGTAHPMPSPLVSLRMQPATGNRRGPSRSSSCSNLGNAIGERVSRASSWLTLSSGRGADVEVDAALHSSEEGHRQVMNMHG